MSLTQVAPPYPIFTDLDGTPLGAGYLYLGFVNTNPETQPIQVFWDSALTIPAAQPIRTTNGYPSRNGTPAMLYTNGAFSITVRNKNKAIVLYAPVGYAINPTSVASSSDIMTILANMGSINTVAADVVNINAVASSITNVDAVANDLTNINLVASDLVNIDAVATNITNINNFFLVYLGTKAADPATRNNGTSLQNGDMYFNTGVNQMKVWASGVWYATTTMGATGAALVAYTPLGSGAVPTNVQTKLRESASFEDFGAIGDGIVDDTSAIQIALNSGIKKFQATPGKIYLINGDLTCSTVGFSLFAAGATFKLKANATYKRMLSLSGAGSFVEGGTWDGNKANGNIPASLYDSYNIGLSGSFCTVRNAESINTAGMCVSGGSISDTLLEGNTISGTGLYGLFLSSGIDAYRNKAVGNRIDMTGSGVAGQGILFTINGAATGQYDWEISNNNVVGSQDAGIGASAINLAVRGHRGVVSNNITRYGAMGWSEGGDNTVITGNSFLDLVGTFRCGIEALGAYGAITGNVITNALSGINMTGARVVGKSVVSNNRIQATIGVFLRPDVGYSAMDVTISGNHITCPSGGNAVYATNTTTGLSITGNILVGPGSGIGATAVFLDKPEASANVSVLGNIFKDWQACHQVYATSPLTVTGLVASGNSYFSCLNSGAWSFSASATCGAAVVATNYTLNGIFSFGKLDQLNNRILSFGQYPPEGQLGAGVGSLHIRGDGSYGATFYIKESGTGNTGWTRFIAPYANAISTTFASITSGPTSAAPTLTAGPVDGNPTKWVPIHDNGTTRYIPTW